MIYYAGIGSRETPDLILRTMTELAKRLANKGYTLRSGGAPGADAAFEQGCDEVLGSKEIYLPWKDCFNNKSKLYWSAYEEEARVIASETHPAWKTLGENVRKLHTRNVYQVLGEDLRTPSDFVLCWTINGELKGGTAQALRIAIKHRIPIYNLGSTDGLDKFKQFYRLNAVFVNVK